MVLQKIFIQHILQSTFGEESLLQLWAQHYMFHVNIF